MTFRAIDIALSICSVSFLSLHVPCTYVMSMKEMKRQNDETAYTRRLSMCVYVSTTGESARLPFSVGVYCSLGILSHLGKHSSLRSRLLMEKNEFDCFLSKMVALWVVDMTQTLCTRSMSE